MAKPRNFDRVCAECVHHDEKRTNLRGSTGRAHYCTRPVDLVTGERGTAPVSCYTMRSKEGQCGPDGRLFERAGKLEAAE